MDNIEREIKHIVDNYKSMSSREIECELEKLILNVQMENHRKQIAKDLENFSKWLDREVDYAISRIRSRGKE